MEREASQLMYHGEWFAVEAGAFEVIARLEDAVPHELLLFTEVDSGRTLWLRAGQVDAVLSGEQHAELEAECEELANTLAEELVLREQDPKECEHRCRRHLARRFRGDR